MSKLRKNMLLKRFALLLTLAPVTIALAGPPFLTDDPNPTDYRHWEVLPFATMTKIPNTATYQAPAVEIDYGLEPDLEVNTTIFYLRTKDEGTYGTSAQGLGDIQLAMTF